MSAVVIVFSLLSTLGCLNGENVGLQSANSFPVANSAGGMNAKGFTVENFQSRLLKSDLENGKIMGQLNTDSFESKHHKSKKLMMNSETLSRASSVTESSTNSNTAASKMSLSSSNTKGAQGTGDGGSTTASGVDTPISTGDKAPPTSSRPGESDPELTVPSLEPAQVPSPSKSADKTDVAPEKTNNPPPTSAGTSDTPEPTKAPVKTPAADNKDNSGTDKGEDKNKETDPDKEKTKPPVVKPPTKEDEKTTPPVVVTKPVVPTETIPEAEEDSSFSSMLYLVVGLAALFFAYRYFKQKFGGPASAQETAYSALPQTEDHGGDIELGSRGGKNNKGSDWEEWESDSDFPAEATNNTRHNVPAGITSTIAKPPSNQSFNTASGSSNIGSTSIKKTSSNDYYKDSSPSTSNKSNRVSTPPAITPFRSTSADFNRLDSGSFDNLPTLDFVPPPAAAIGRLSAKTAAGKPSSSTPVKKSRSPATQDVDLFASIGMSAAPKFREPVKAPEPAFQRPSGPSRISAMAEEQEDSRGRSTWDEDQELDDLMGDD